MDEEISQLVCTTRDPLLSSSNVAMAVTGQLSQTSSSAYFSTPLNSPLLLSPSTSLWSPVSMHSPKFLAQDGVTSQTINSDEEFQTPEVLGEIVIGDEEESEGLEEMSAVCLRTPNYGSARSRTPRTLSRLLEQHRTSERNRHHDLNATINHICSGIPGFNPYVRETKIVKLQRIINYICHVESHIHSLCDEMGVTLDFKNIFLSAKTDDSMKMKCSSHESASKREHAHRTQRHYEPEAPIPFSISKKMKHRSSAVDSTIKDEAEDELEWLKNCSGLDSPDTSILTPDDCDQILSSLDVGAQVTVDEQLEDNPDEESCSSQSVPFPAFTSLYDSYQASQRVPLAETYPCSPQPRKRSQRHFHLSEACVPSTPTTPLRRSQRRRVLRSPLLRLASLFKDSSSEYEEEEEEEDKHDDDFRCAAIPKEWDKPKNDTKSSTGQKQTKRKSKNSSRAQVDHRKTSWMNGFMMYSQIHRRRYIRDNPGVHTSHISKLMGHDWRSMTSGQQKPYKEKAGEYTKQFLMPSSRSLTNHTLTKEEIKTEAYSSSIGHLVPCFHGNADCSHGDFQAMQSAMQSVATPAFVKLETEDSLSLESHADLQETKDKDQPQDTLQPLRVDFQSKGPFTQLSSSPSKRSLDALEHLSLVHPMKRHAGHGQVGQESSNRKLPMLDVTPTASPVE